VDADGIPHQALRKARGSDALAMSQPVFDEVFDVLHRPRLARFIDVDLRAELPDHLVSGTLWFEPSVVVHDCRDEGDNKYLELALTAGASLIVSGDQDLLVLSPWRGVTILRPASYLGTGLTDAPGPFQPSGR
jgi:hypothetical protein